MNKLEQYRGCLLGLAVGDALGTTLEFKAPGTFQPISDMVGGGPFELKTGQWTDDTSMALCLAASLMEKKGFDALDQMQRYVRWWGKGYMSSTGRCFDIGNTCRVALMRFQESGKPMAGSTETNSAGNGSLMRLAPVPLFFASEPDKAIEMAGEASKTTHGASTAVDACRYFAGLIVGALNGASKEELLSPMYSPVPGYWDNYPLCKEIAEVALGSFKTKEPPQIRGTGYVVQSIEAALWAFNSSMDFREGALLAVNLGDDADTTGAIYGQLAGAFHGETGIPQGWLTKLHQREMISGLAEKLCSEKKAPFILGAIKKSSHPRDPLHGITLEHILNELVQRHGWDEMAQRIPIRCFQFNPSVKSSLTFLRKTPWARQKVEGWFIAELSKK